jgi:integrase
MREGRVFRRCTSCHRRVKGRRCACGRGKVTWAYVVDLAPPGEKRRQSMRSGFSDEASARAAMNRVQIERAEGLYVEPTKLTAGRYLRDWIKGLIAASKAARASSDDRQPGDERDNTLIGWEVAVRVQLAPRLDGIQLQQLAKPQVRALYRELRANGRKSGGPLAPKSVWNIHLCLHRALKDAISDGLIKINPASGAMRRPKGRPEIRFWVGAQLARFLSTATDPRERTLYRVAGQTGMRLGELLGLRWTDVDLEAGLISVRQQLSRRRGGGYQFGPPKTRAGSRTINVSPETVAALRAWRAQQELFRRAWGDAYQLEDDLAFCREDGSKLDGTQAGKRFLRLVELAKMPRIRFHDLRHTSAVIGLRELGEWPDETSARLGHSSVAFTLDTYGHLLPKRGVQVAAAFDRLLREAIAS